MIERVRDYRHKLVVLRQIMSNKARRYGRLNTAMKIATVFISSLLTFMGFTGIDNLSNYLSWFVSLTQEQVQLVFNLGVLGLFIVVILYLVFRFSEREAEASKAIVSITHLKNSVDDLLLKTERGRHVTEVDLQLVSEKYEMLIEVLPSNSDREYKKALREVPVKQVAKLTLQLAAQDLFIPRHQEEVLRVAVADSVPEATFDETVVRGHCEQSVFCYSSNAKLGQQYAQVSIYPYQSLRILHVILSMGVALVVRLPVVHPQEESRARILPDELQCHRGDPRPGSSSPPIVDLGLGIGQWYIRPVLHVLRANHAGNVAPRFEPFP